VELNAVNSAADAALTLSLAGTIFSIPTGEARGQVALFLLITMAPFTVMAPMVGPLLDRFRHGRRWAIGTTLATRAFLCWVLADAVATKSAWFFPAALGCLVASRAYNVARASAVPRLLPHGFSLVAANSRQSLAGVAGMVLGGAIAGAATRIGPDWSLRAAFVIYVVGTVLAIQLPARVDSTRGERHIGQITNTSAAGPWASPWSSAWPSPRGGPLRRFRRRVDALPQRVLFALWCTAGTRLLAGSLTFFLAFLLRDHLISGLSGTLVLGLVVAAAGLGNTVGSMLGTHVKGRAPETIAAAILLLAGVTALTTAVLYSVWTLLALGGLDPSGPRSGGRAVLPARQAQPRRARATRRRRGGAYQRLRMVRDAAADRLGHRWRAGHRPAAHPPARIRGHHRSARRRVPDGHPKPRRSPETQSRGGTARGGVT